MKENGRFVELWYERLEDIASQTGERRYKHLTQLHQETLDFYLPTIQSITSQKALEKSSDGRPISLVVAHILAWEEWQIQAFTDPNSLERISQLMKFQNYYDPERGLTKDFLSVDEFNEHQAEKYSEWKWEDIQRKAVDTALALQSLFPANSQEDWVEFLENTPTHAWRFTSQKTITVPSGLYLWMVSLEHEAVEHRKDLVAATS